MDRRNIVEQIIDDLAWANRNRDQLESDIHTPQEILDLFRDKLVNMLAYMADKNIPKTIEDQRKFVHRNWEIFLVNYIFNQLEAGHKIHVKNGTL